MTVLDRMALWSRKENEEPSLVSGQDCLFEGVRNMEEDDIAGNAKMVTYREFVLRSTGYQWFIESLKKQLSLDWGSDDLAEASSCRLIHQSIMSRIPSGIISRHRTPEIHRARFRIQMRPGVFHYLEKGRAVANLMTLTSSAPNIVQALSVQEYLDQTWSSGGLRLVEIMKKACDGGYGAIHTGMSLTFEDKEPFHGIQADEHQTNLMTALASQHSYRGWNTQPHPTCWSQFLALRTQFLKNPDIRAPLNGWRAPSA
jgi:hypothetical protein